MKTIDQPAKDSDMILKKNWKICFKVTFPNYFENILSIYTLSEVQV